MKTNVVLARLDGHQGLGNPLTDACGPPMEDADRLARQPPIPKPIDDPRRIAADPQALWRIRIRTQAECQMLQRLDALIRMGDSHRMTNDAATRQRIDGVGTHRVAETVVCRQVDVPKSGRVDDLAQALIDLIRASGDEARDALFAQLNDDEAAA